jgi:hypothetical protein
MAEAAKRISPVTFSIWRNQMSAYIVSHDTIDVLVTFAIDNRINFRVGNVDCISELTSATEIGKLLMLECERSVQYRYPNDDNADLPGTIGERASNYEFKRAECLREFMRQHAEEYDYQACETDDYEQSVAYQIIRAIETELEKSND